MTYLLNYYKLAVTYIVTIIRGASMKNDYYEARQHLNLSQQAYDIIESDKFDFMVRPSFAGMLNLAFAAYCHDANASVDTAVSRYEEIIRDITANIPDDCTKKQMISAFTEKRRADLANAANAYPRGKSFKFQLSRENYEFIQEWRDDGDYYHSSAAKYIKAVIEEYASKSYFEREKIILRDRLSLLQSFADSGRLLSITSGSGDSTQRFMVKPYCLCADKGNSFHYLVGLSTPYASDREEKPASFRVSRIKKITTLSSHSGGITAAQKKLIDVKMNKVGVQFMTQEQETVTVYLTAEGRQQYERQTNLRPICTDKRIFETGDGEYIFQCAPMQALFYFFKFGADAVILSPSELQAEFSEKYEQAYKKYKEDNV